MQAVDASFRLAVGAAYPGSLKFWLSAAAKARKARAKKWLPTCEQLLSKHAQIVFARTVLLSIFRLFA
jgi:hypothetical protein